MRGLFTLIAVLLLLRSAAAQEAKTPDKLLLTISFYEGVAPDDKASLGPHHLGTATGEVKDKESISIALDEGGVAVHGRAASVLGNRLLVGIVVRGTMPQHDAREATLDLSLNVAGRIRPAGEGFKGLVIAEHQVRLAGALAYDRPLKLDLPREWFAIAETDLLQTKDQPVWAEIVIGR